MKVRRWHDLIGAETPRKMAIRIVAEGEVIVEAVVPEGDAGRPQPGQRLHLELKTADGGSAGHLTPHQLQRDDAAGVVLLRFADDAHPADHDATPDPVGAERPTGQRFVGVTGEHAGDDFARLIDEGKRVGRARLSGRASSSPAHVHADPGVRS